MTYKKTGPDEVTKTRQKKEKRGRRLVGRITILTSELKDKKIMYMTNYAGLQTMTYDCMLMTQTNINKMT